jgi:hypothetical protein
MREENQDFASVAEKVSLVPELLEGILLHLSLGDILYNAQRVNQFWRDCIGVANRAGGSPSLRQKCFIDAKPMNEEQKKKDPLFLTFDFPEPIAPRLDRIDNAICRKFCERPENAALTFSEIRRTFSNNATDTRALLGYVRQMHLLWRTALEDGRHVHNISKFAEYCPNPEWRWCQHQLDNKKRHPMLDCFDNIPSFWTGYQSHVIFAICERKTHSYGPMKQVSEAIKFLLSMEPAEATWKRGMVTQPVCTQVTVFVRIPTPAHSEHQSFLNIDGVTIEEFFQTIIGVCKAALYDFGEEHLFTRVSPYPAAEQRQAVMAVADLRTIAWTYKYNALHDSQTGACLKNRTPRL